MRTRVKICGITRTEDALAATEAGVDALGFVFYARSPRAVDVATMTGICRALPPFVSRVALFVNPDVAEVEQVVASGQIDLLQFHGQETPAFCGQFNLPYMKALAMHPEMNVAETLAQYADASGLLLDAWHPAVPGGSGETFDWERIPAERPRPLVLAGGLTPRNVAQAIKQTHPYAVDVSSGVEISKGIKDANLISAFMQGVESVNTKAN